MVRGVSPLGGSRSATEEAQPAASARTARNTATRIVDLTPWGTVYRSEQQGGSHGQRARSDREGAARGAERGAPGHAGPLVPERLRGRHPVPHAGPAAGSPGGDLGVPPLYLRRRLERRARAVRAGARQARVEQPVRALKPRALFLGGSPGRDGGPGFQALGLRAFGSA